MAQLSMLEDQLDAQLRDLEQDPSQPLDEKLLDSCHAFLATQLLQQPDKLTILVTRLSRLLSSFQQDPTPIVRLLSRLIEPFTFTDVLALKPPVDFVAGLHKDALPFNLLVLQILQKAATSAKDAAIFAGMPEVVHALVTLWLSTPDMGVAETSSNVILDLLKVDRQTGDGSAAVVDDEYVLSQGQGLMWRRIFDDKDIYSLLYSLPSLKTADDGLSKREKTTSQARILALLPRIGALDWTYLVRSHHSEVESRYGSKDALGLLNFACEHMVDYKEDVLLHISLVNFFTELIREIKTPSTRHPIVSVSLDFLMLHRLHDRALSYWLDPTSNAHDPVDLSFLYRPSAHYISAYASRYPESFVSSDTLRPTLSRLTASVQIAPSKWAHGQTPKHDLHVLSTLPRVALLPQSFLEHGINSSSLLQLPIKVTNEDALNTLATVFYVPGPKADNAASVVSPVAATEAHAARLLYNLYLYHHPTFYTEVLSHADTVAIPEKALAALNLLSAIVAAHWDASPPSNSSLADLNKQSSLDLALNSLPPTNESTSGSNNIPLFLRSPGIALFDYLLAPARQFSNLVGGRGDTESAAYKIAMARWDLVLLFKRRLDEYMPNGIEEEDMMRGVRDAIQDRVNQGVWGVESQVGGRIATLEL